MATGTLSGSYLAVAPTTTYSGTLTGSYEAVAAGTYSGTLTGTYAAVSVAASGNGTYRFVGGQVVACTWYRWDGTAVRQVT